MIDDIKLIIKLRTNTYYLVWVSVIAIFSRRYIKRWYWDARIQYYRWTKDDDKKYWAIYKGYGVQA